MDFNFAPVTVSHKMRGIVNQTLKLPEHESTGRWCHRRYMCCRGRYLQQQVHRCILQIGRTRNCNAVVLHSACSMLVERLKECRCLTSSCTWVEIANQQHGAATILAKPAGEAFADPMSAQVSCQSA